MAHKNENIKAIVFDLGGVVIDLKRENAVAALEALGIKNADELLGLYRQDGPFLALEIGKISAAGFFDTMRVEASASGAPAPADMLIQEAFNSFLVALPVERLERLRALKSKGYRIFALSNTNPVMYPTWIAEHFKQEGLHINDYFEGIVTSFSEGCCKPDAEIFRRLLVRYDLDPASTLMLDDSEANCEAARSTGMQALRVGTTSATDMMALTLPFCG